MKFVQIFDEGDILQITEKLNLKMHDIVFQGTRTSFYQRLENLDGHSAVLVCFITNDAKSQQFTVKFRPIGHGKSTLQYSTITGNRDGRGVHVFMWTEGSRLFKECSVFSEFFVALSHDSRHHVSLSQGFSSINVEERGHGWIIMVDKKLDASKVCKELLKA